VAAEPALPWRDGRFLTVYATMRTETERETIDSSPVGQVILELIRQQCEWTGPLSALLSRVRSYVYCHGGRCPGSPRALRAAIDRLTPSLRRVGIHVEFRRTRSGSFLRVWRSGPTRAQSSSCAEAQ